MLYTEKEKHEIERVKEVFAEHLRQSPDFELLWSDKVDVYKRQLWLMPLRHRPAVFTPTTLPVSSSRKSP